MRQRQKLWVLVLLSLQACEEASKATSQAEAFAAELYCGQSRQNVEDVARRLEFVQFSCQDQDSPLLVPALGDPQNQFFARAGLFCFANDIPKGKTYWSEFVLYWDQEGQLRDYQVGYERFAAGDVRGPYALCSVP